MNRIFIVEDDAVIAKTMAEHLSSWDMEVKTVQDFQNVTKEVEAFDPDLVLMDIKLPYYNGFFWCQEIRKTSKVPIVFLSSADDNMNIVMAMNMGGDDFISKPFDLNVLTAKIQAMIRRSYDYKIVSNVMTYNGLTLNLDDTTAEVDGEKLELSRNEFLITKTLMEKQGKIVSREELMERLWGNEEFIDDNTLTVNVTRIRKKLEMSGKPDFIKTKRGLGYVIE